MLFPHQKGQVRCPEDQLGHMGLLLPHSSCWRPLQRASKQAKAALVCSGQLLPDCGGGLCGVEQGREGMEGS